MSLPVSAGKGYCTVQTRIIIIKSIYHMSTVQVPLAQQEAKDSKFAFSVSHKTRLTITTSSACGFIYDEAGWVIGLEPMYMHLA